MGSLAGWHGTSAGGDDSLVFPEGAARLTNINNLPKDTPFGSPSGIKIGPRYNLSGSEIVLSGGLFLSGPSSLFTAFDVSVGFDIVLGTDLSIEFNSPQDSIGAGGSIEGDINLNGHHLSITCWISSDSPGSNRTAFGGVIGGAGSIGISSSLRPVSFLGHNTYTGETSLGSGSWLKAETADALGTSAANVAPGSLLEVSIDRAIFANPLTISGDGPHSELALRGVGAVSITGGFLVQRTGLISLNDDSAIGIHLGGATVQLGAVVKTNGHNLTLLGSLNTVLASGGVITGGGHVIQQGTLLQGTGQIDQSVPASVTAGTVDPGDGPTAIGTLTTGAISFSAGTTFQPDLGPAGSSMLAAQGLVDLNSAQPANGPTLRIKPSAPVDAGQAFTVFTSTTGINGTFQDAAGKVLVDGSVVTADDGETFVVHYLKKLAPAGRIIAAGSPTENSQFTIVRTPERTAVSLVSVVPSGTLPWGQTATITVSVLDSSGLPLNVSVMDVIGTVQIVYTGASTHMTPMAVHSGQPNYAFEVTDEGSLPSSLPSDTYAVTVAYFPTDATRYMASPVVSLGNLKLDTAPVLAFQSATVDARETDSTVAIVVTHSGGSPGAAVSVGVQFDPNVHSTALANVDYQWPPIEGTTLNWGPGDLATTKQFTINLRNDGASDANNISEILGLQLVQASGAKLDTQRTTTLTIREEGMIQFDAASFTSQEIQPNDPQPHATITVTRSGGSGGPASVTLQFDPNVASTAQGLVDYQWPPKEGTTLSWADTETGQKTFTIPLLDDQALGETNEILGLQLVASGATLGPQTTTILAIQEDNDQPPPPPGTLQFDRAGFAANEGSGPTKVVTVSRVGGGNGVVSVMVQASGGTAILGKDYSLQSKTLTWANGVTGSQPVMLTLPDDDQAGEANETLGLQLVNPLGGAILSDLRNTTLTIQEDDDFPAGQTLASSGSGAPPFVVVTAAHGLDVVQPGAAPVPVGAPGTIRSVTAVTEAGGMGHLVAFVVTADGGLARLDVTARAWKPLGAPHTIGAASAGTDASGQSDVFVLTADDLLTEWSSSGGWLRNPIGGRGSILQMHALAGNEVVAVTADHSVFRYGPTQGWGRYARADWAQSVDASTDAQGHLAIYALRADHSVWRRSEDSPDWHPILGNITSLSAGGETGGGHELFVVTDGGAFFELGDTRPLMKLGDPGTVRAFAAAGGGKVLVAGGDGSLLEFDDATGWLALSGSGLVGA